MRPMGSPGRRGSLLGVLSRKSGPTLSRSPDDSRRALFGLGPPVPANASASVTTRKPMTAGSSEAPGPVNTVEALSYALIEGRVTLVSVNGSGGTVRRQRGNQA